MKKYIGTKQIEAEPMTMGEAFEKGLLKAGRVPNESEKSNAGYHVKYQDGYESWSPAGPFEKAYKVCETFTDRIQLIVPVIVRQDLEDRPIPVCHRFKLLELSIIACLLALEDIAVPPDVPGVVVSQPSGQTIISHFPLPLFI